jgi:chloramphenicol-sensitive protein RarD
MNKGILYGLGAYICWGIFPIYFKWIQNVPAIQILAHRIFWSFIFLIILVVLRKEFHGLRASIKSPRMIGVYLVASCFLAVNWLTYIWGVNNGFIIETSLGYFINPLVNVLLGVLFFHERLRPFQWGIVGLAGFGVIYLTISYGQLPWIALILAFSFGTYGLIKKMAPLGSFYGLTLETGLLAGLALAYLLLMGAQGAGSLGQVNHMTDLLLIGTGVMTTIPLLMFGTAARSLPLSTLGILQYIAPTGQFLIGVLVYNEPFTQERLIGFSIIWLALALFWIESFIQRPRPLAAQVN